MHVCKYDTEVETVRHLWMQCKRHTVYGKRKQEDLVIWKQMMGMSTSL